MDPNQQDGLGRSRFHLACQSDEPALVKSLLAQGANPNLMDREGFTPVHMAIRYECAGVLEVLLAAKPDLALVDVEHGGTYVHHALQGGAPEMVRMLLEAGAPADRTDKEGWTPLWFASGADDLEMMQLLLDHGAGVDSVNPGGVSLLAAAREARLSASVALFEKLGAKDVGGKKKAPAKKTVAKKKTAPRKAKASSAKKKAVPAKKKVASKKVASKKVASKKVASKKVASKKAPARKRR